ncbi:MAG: hypothetical protein JO061_17975 [Acidobacteriaceae bacterium]|nr:hypothetical protein [Acidobacteriaceae bacterium]
MQCKCGNRRRWKTISNQSGLVVVRLSAVKEWSGRFGLCGAGWPTKLATGGRVAESAFSRVRIGAAASAAQEYILPHIQPIGVALDQGNS